MKSDRDYINLAVQLNRIGDVYFARGDLDKAKEMYIAVKNLAETHKEIPPLVLAHNYSDLGDVYYATGYVKKEEKECIQQYNKSLPLYQTINYHNDMVSVLIRKGKMRYQQKEEKGELGKDWEMYMRALHQCREQWVENGVKKMKFTDERNYALCMVALGNLCLKRVDSKKSIDDGEKEKLKDLEEELKVYIPSIAIINDGKIFSVNNEESVVANGIEESAENDKGLLEKVVAKVQDNKVDGLFFKLAEICLLIAGRSLMRHAYGLDDAWSARELGRLYYHYYLHQEECGKLLDEARRFFEIADELYASNINDNPFISWAYADNCFNLANSYFELYKCTEAKEDKSKWIDICKKYYKKALGLYLEPIRKIAQVNVPLCRFI